MRANIEAYYRPENVSEVLRLLNQAKGEARIVAGGTDLAVAPDSSARILIDITRAGLSYIRKGRDNFVIGAATTMAELEESPILGELAGGLLCRAAAACGSIEIRNMATLGGNLANGSPAADMAAPLLALDASVVLADARTKRMALLSDFLGKVDPSASPYLLTEVVIPAPESNAGYGWSFQKFGRTAVDIALLNVAAALQLDKQRQVRRMRIAVGAAAPTPVRAVEAEALANGRLLDRALLADICETVARELRPVTDQRAPASYRRKLAHVLTGRAIADCAAQAGHAL